MADQPTETKPNAILARLREKAKAGNRNYLTEGHAPQAASLSAVTCPCCGAGRGQGGTLRTCAHCGHEFLKSELSDGIYLKTSDN